MRKRAYVDLVADFETTTDEADCRVWAWGLGNVDHEPYFKHGNSIESFIAEVEAYDSNIYFHNLGFDMYFILDRLMRTGYVHVDGNAEPGQFSTLIDRMGKVYTITVNWRTGYKTQFRDSLKRIPMPVSGIAKTFDLPILKGSIDYEAYRAPGHILTTEELEYLKNDVHIVAMALAIQRDEGMQKLTVGSDALFDYKNITGADTFNLKFPLLSREDDANIRRAYRGGFTYADPRFAGRVVGPGNVYDVNSLYPSVMASKRLPYGSALYYPSLGEAREHMADTDVFVTRLVFGAKLRDGHIPCIQIKGDIHFKATEYQRVIPGGTEMWVSSVDLDLWERHYEMDIESASDTYVFRTMTGLFDDYIMKWGSIKENSFGGRRAIAKLFLICPIPFTVSLPPIQTAPARFPCWKTTL